MSLCLSSKDGVKARKTYRCCFCDEIIPKDSHHDVRSGVSCGDMWTMRMHPECHALEEATPWQKREDWYDNFGDGPVFDRPSKQETPDEPNTISP